MNAKDIRKALDEYGLTSDDAVVIGSGILAALGIRESHDVDLVVNDEAWRRLHDDQRLEAKDGLSGPLLVGRDIEIGRTWKVLGSARDLDALAPDSAVIDGVRYVTLDFLRKVKQDRSSGPSPRSKDVEDVRLIREYRKA